MLVLGMHRSGTSAIANALERGGLFGWEEDEGMRASLENPAGYGERYDVMDLNERMLAELGWTWDSPDPVPPAKPPALTSLVAEGRDLVERKLGPRGPWVLKDPRISLLLPWWRRIAMDRFVAVVTLRAPEEVAWSLSVRDGFPMLLGLALWGAYYRHLAAGLQGLPAVVVSYPALTDSPAETLARMLSELQRLGVSQDLDVEAAASAIHPRLRRETQPGSVRESVVSERVLDRVFEEWSQGKVTAHEHFALEIDGPEPWESATLESHRSLRMEEARSRVAVERATAALTEAQASLEALASANAEAEAARQSADAIGKELETARAEADAARQSTEALGKELETARAEAEARAREAEFARAQVDSLGQEVDSANAEAGAARQAAAALRGELNTVRADAKARGREAESARAEADSLRQALASANAEADAARQSTEALGKELETARAEAAAERQEIARAKAEAERLQSELAAVRARAGRRRVALRRFLHFLGLRGYVRANPLFDSAWYLAAYPDVRLAGIDAYWHYRSYGMREGRNPNSAFDTDWYVQQNPDVARAGQDPLEHYLRIGSRLGRDPSPRFDTSWYLAQNPDVAAAGVNPLLHYLRHGAGEGRQPRLTAPQVDSVSTVDAAHAAARGESLAADTAGPMILEAVARFRRSLSAESRLAVITDGNSALESGLQETAMPFPSASSNPGPDGHFTNSTSAIAHLEAMRADAASHFLIPAGVGSWLFELPSFSAHLGRYPVVVNDAGSVAYDLHAPYGPDEPSLAIQLPLLVEAFRLRHGRHPAILDVHTGIAYERYVPETEVFTPEILPDGRLPYADGSIDLVVAIQDAPSAGEIERVARSALITLRGADAHTAASVQWLTQSDLTTLPSVSIVIPTFNGLALVRECLRTLRETMSPDIDVEVIVVDDASTTDSPDALRQLVAGHPRATLLHNESNLGFVGSVNRGADAAEGDVLVLLNNDTILLPGWLGPLLKTFDEHPDAGAVGGKLIFPDGRLQEAGNVMFSDGSAANFGFGDTNPELPQYSYIRDVDYVSGALLATRRSLFLELGRMDGVYGFGYYDDADYCFKLRDRGMRTYFNPESVIVHLQGGTAGTDMNAGPKQYQRNNRHIFVERWAERLRHQPTPPHGGRRAPSYAKTFVRPGARAAT